MEFYTTFCELRDKILLTLLHFLMIYRSFRQEVDNYDPEEILSRSIQKEKGTEATLKGSSDDQRRHVSPERYRSRSSFSDRYICCP